MSVRISSGGSLGAGRHGLVDGHAIEAGLDVGLACEHLVDQRVIVHLADNAGAAAQATSRPRNHYD